MVFLKFFIIGFFLSVLCISLALKIFPKMGLLDFPQRYNLKRKRLPYPGGLVLFLLSFLILFLDTRFYVLSVPFFFLGLISFIDDFKNLSAKYRLLIHFSMAILVFLFGVKIDFIGNPFQETNFELGDNFPLISFFLTVFWIVSIQNAMNWFDGLPGLAPGISAVGFLALGLLGILRPELFFDTTHQSLTFANFYLAGMCLGGFYFFWTKKIILGDTGSQVLGFLLAVMSIFSGAKIATTLLVLILPVLDFFVVIGRRAIFEKKSPFKGDLKHLHHLLARKVSEKWTVLLLIFLSSIFGGVSLFFSGVHKLIVLMVVSVFVLSLTVWLNVSRKTSQDS